MFFDISPTGHRMIELIAPQIGVDYVFKYLQHIVVDDMVSTLRRHCIFLTAQYGRWRWFNLEIKNIFCGFAVLVFIYLLFIYFHWNDDIGNDGGDDGSIKTYRFADDDNN